MPGTRSPCGLGFLWQLHRTCPLRNRNFFLKQALSFHFREKIMPKTFEQRLARLEKVISDFFTGSGRAAKKTARTVKRKAKKARQSVAKKVGSRKTARRGRRRA